MELPSIKFNIFTKLEYFLVIKEFDKQFKVQFKLLKSKEWNKEKCVFQATYPTWEVEKKILFWSYLYHKHLGSPIRENNFNEMFICADERKFAGIKQIFENLELRGFGEKEDSGEGFYFNEEGLAFGELLWFLCEMKKGKKQYKNDKPDNYFSVYKTDYKLTRKISCGYWLLQTQLISTFLLMLYGILFFILEFLQRMGLLDNFKAFMAIQIFIIPFISLAILPFILLGFSWFFYWIYRLWRVDNKVVRIEELKNHR